MNEIYCVETGKTFKSSICASKETGIEASTIRRACAGERRTAGGYHWRKGSADLFHQITSNKESLAKKLVYRESYSCYNGGSPFVGGVIVRETWRSTILDGFFLSKEEAIKATLKELSR